MSDGIKENFFNWNESFNFYNLFGKLFKRYVNSFFIKKIRDTFEILLENCLFKHFYDLVHRLTSRYSFINFFKWTLSFNLISLINWLDLCAKHYRYRNILSTRPWFSTITSFMNIYFFAPCQATLLDHFIRLNKLDMFVLNSFGRSVCKTKFEISF